MQEAGGITGDDSVRGDALDDEREGSDPRAVSDPDRPNHATARPEFDPVTDHGAGLPPRHGFAPAPERDVVPQ